ncbi:MAG: NnrU family protein, partial [Gammaproteobacteria bacterium]|nr:NnrU family protein [Gammaproteobacteria bacterium]
ARAPFQFVWQPQSWGADAALILMALASILLVSAYLPSNVKRFTRHPMLWAVTLWALAHLLANGDLASILMFAALGLFSLFDMASANRRGASKQGESKSLTNDLLVLIAGIVVFALLWYLHPLLFGVGVG